jgi:hypothetical protein
VNITFLTFSLFLLQASCCSEGLFPGGLSLPSYNNKVAPSDIASTRSTSITHSPSGESHSVTPSYDSRRRRRKPLAVAVGFKYAEDVNGRPVVITRTSPPGTPSRVKKQLRECDDYSNDYASPQFPYLIQDYQEEKA